MEEIMYVNELRFHVSRLIGHGKGGYSYLVTDGNSPYVLKQIHHEPCDYYAFGDKLEAEVRDYNRLLVAGIRIPQLMMVDKPRERILKEFIDGPTIAELVGDDAAVRAYLPQVIEMSGRARAAGLNIDYYPTNFVVRMGVLWYIDYECNEYSEEWNFENWGRKCWFPEEKNT